MKNKRYHVTLLMPNHSGARMSFRLKHILSTYIIDQHPCYAGIKDRAAEMLYDEPSEANDET